MAKRVGNVARVEDLRTQGISAAAVRHFMFSVHYRKQLNLTEESLDASSNAVRRVGDFAERLAAATAGTQNMSALAADLQRAAITAFNDDLNAPEAMAALFEFIRMVNAELDAGGTDAAGLDAARKAFALVNGVLDIVPEEPEVDDALSGWVEERLAARREARARRDFAAADAIRGELDGKGIAIEDTPQGTRWKKVR
jgi:cysteinyl-tRNA synthetase